MKAEKYLCKLSRSFYLYRIQTNTLQRANKFGRGKLFLNYRKY